MYNVHVARVHVARVHVARVHVSRVHVSRVHVARAGCWLTCSSTSCQMPLDINFAFNIFDL